MMHSVITAVNAFYSLPFFSLVALTKQRNGEGWTEILNRDLMKPPRGVLQRRLKEKRKKSTGFYLTHSSILDQKPLHLTPGIAVLHLHQTCHYVIKIWERYHLDANEDFT